MLDVGSFRLTEDLGFQIDMNTLVPGVRLLPADVQVSGVTTPDGD